MDSQTKKITWYEVTNSLSVKHNGEVCINDALLLLDRYIENQNHLDGSGEDAIAKCLFGFSIFDRTFIEISIDTTDQFRILFEHPQYKSLYQSEYKIFRLLDIREVIENFFKLPIGDFLLFFDNLPYKRMRR